MLYSQLPLVGPYSTLNIFTPEYGAQLKNILVGLSLLDSTIIGATTLSGISAQKGAAPPPAELELAPDAEEVAVVVVEQVETITVVLFIDTAPFLAKSLPWTVEPPLSVTETRAKILPTKFEPVPRVAELVTCQKTLQGWAPLIRLTTLPEAVTKSEDA